MADNDEQTLAARFNECEKCISLLQSGEKSMKDIQSNLRETIETLQSLTISVNKLQLYSSNENHDELPSGSLSFMLIPCYLGICHQNTMNCNPLNKIEELRMAKVYFRDFLKRLREYSVVEFDLPWKANEGEEDDEDRRLPPRTSVEEAERRRQDKIARFRSEKEQEALVETLRKQRTLSPDDESTLRDLVLAQLRYWAFRALAELESIDQELPMLEHMAKVQSGEVQQPAKGPLPPAKKPFIITRDAAQKAVFGLGYPSIPVMSVDEWYEEREKKGLFGPNGPGGSGVSKPPEGRLSDSENEDDGRDDERRARLQNWDEYKDTHRRGWGNTHNKG